LIDGMRGHPGDTLNVANGVPSPLQLVGCSRLGSGGKATHHGPDNGIE